MRYPSKGENSSKMRCHLLKKEYFFCIVPIWLCKFPSDQPRDSSKICIHNNNLTTDNVILLLQCLVFSAFILYSSSLNIIFITLTEELMRVNNTSVICISLKTQLCYLVAPEDCGNFVQFTKRFEQHKQHYLRRLMWRSFLASTEFLYKTSLWHC